MQNLSTNISREYSVQDIYKWRTCIRKVGCDELYSISYSRIGFSGGSLYFLVVYRSLLKCTAVYLAQISGLYIVIYKFRRVWKEAVIDYF